MRHELTQLWLTAVRLQARILLPDHEEWPIEIDEVSSVVYRRALPSAYWAFVALLANPTSDCFTAECGVSQDGEFPFSQHLVAPRDFPSVGRATEPFDGKSYRFRLVMLWDPRDHWFCVGAAAWRTARLEFMADLRALLERHSPAIPSNDEILAAEVECALRAYRRTALPLLQQLVDNRSR